MKMWKRGFAALLSAAMLASLLPITALADELEQKPAASESEMGTVLSSDTQVNLEYQPSQQQDSDSRNLEDSEQREDSTLASVSVDAQKEPDAEGVGEDEAELEGAGDSEPEIGYRFSDTEPWTIIGVGRSSAGRVFDENRNYAIYWDRDREITAPVQIMVWTADGQSKEYMKTDGSWFSFADEKGVIAVNSGAGYTLSIYASWLEGLDYTTAGKTVHLTSDQAWYNAHQDSYKFAQKGTYTIELERDEDNPYANSLPCQVSFTVPGGETTLTEAKDAVINGTEAVFQKQGASVKVGGYTVSVHDSMWGEVTFSPPGTTSTLTLGQDTAWAKGHENNYLVPTGNIYTISLSPVGAYPQDVTFSVRGYVNPTDAFSDKKDVTVATEAPYTVSFQKQDASVKVGQYVIQVHDDRAGEVRYSLNGVGKTIGKDADWEKAHSDYVCLNESEYKIPMSDSDTFPAEVRFDLPRDQVTELAFSDFKDAAIKEGTTDTVIFQKQDSSVKLAGYTFTLHSPWVGAVRYQISGSGRTMYVGRDVDYAADAKQKAADETAEIRKENPSAAAKEPDYVCFESGKHVIHLKSYEGLPKDVVFTQWDESQGWNNPEKQKTVTFNGTKADQEVFGGRFSVDAEWLDEISYQLPGGGTITVGHDSDKATRLSNYELFDDDGNYAINPNDSIIFPCTVRFTVRNASGNVTEVEETFETADKQIEIRGHQFTIRKMWRGEIVYTANGASKTIGHDKAWADSHPEYGYIGDDNTYTIKLDGDVSFPLDITFRMRDGESSKTLTFKNLEDQQAWGGVTFSVHPVWQDEVTFTWVYTYTKADGKVEERSKQVTVGNDAEKAEKAKESAQENLAAERKTNPNAPEVLPDYILAENNAYTIPLVDDAFFPYPVQFQYNRLHKNGDNLEPQLDTRTVWFEGPEKDAEPEPIGGYKFTAQSARKDPNRLVSAGLWVGQTAAEDGTLSGGKYVPLVTDMQYWDDKEAEEEYNASLQSLLPLREKTLYANLNGFFDWELKNTRLELVPPAASDLPANVKAAKAQAAWSRARYGDYQIVNNGDLVDTYSNTYEMIVGQLDQLNIEDYRYIVQIQANPPGFSNNLIKMKASYADEAMTSIRIKGDRFNADNGEYTFIVNDQWKDGPVYLTMWLNEDLTGYDYDTLKQFTPSVVEGDYGTVDQLLSAASSENAPVDITERIWGQELDTQPADKRYTADLTRDNENAPCFTVIWKRDGNPVAVMPVRVLVWIDPDAEWELPEEARTDVIHFGIPHTHNTTIKNEDGVYENWELLPPWASEYNADIDANVLQYRMPNDADSVAADRFFVSATYRHFTRKDDLDGLGKKAEADLYEPASTDDYYGKYTDVVQSPSEQAQEDGQAFWQEYGIKVYAGSRSYATLEDAEAAAKGGNATDVTSQIFTRVGYGASFTSPIVFTAFNGSGEQISCIGIQVKSSEPEVDFGTPTKQNDARFHLRGSYTNRETGARVWRMPSCCPSN